MNPDDCDVEVYRVTKPSQVGLLGATAVHRPTRISASVSHYQSSKDVVQDVLAALAREVAEATAATDACLSVKTEE